MCVCVCVCNGGYAISDKTSGWVRINFIVNKSTLYDQAVHNSNM